MVWSDQKWRVRVYVGDREKWQGMRRSEERMMRSVACVMGGVKWSGSWVDWLLMGMSEQGCGWCRLWMGMSEQGCGWCWLWMGMSEQGCGWCWLWKGVVLVVHGEH